MVPNLWEKTHPDGRVLVADQNTAETLEATLCIQDDSGKAIPGFALDDCPPVFGDSTGRIVTWKGGTDLSSLPGRPVRLRFEIKDADLYAYRFTSGS